MNLLRRLLSFLPVYLGGVAVALLTATCGGCQQKPVEAPTVQQPVRELKFDPRYHDSLDVPNPTARTLREIAIYQQLSRLHSFETRARLAKQLKANIPHYGRDSVFEKLGKGPMRGYADSAAYMVDVHRKLDSLKVLEHIPLTPY